MLEQFGIVLNILSQNTEQNCRNCQTDICDGSLLLHCSTVFTEPCLDIFLCEDCGTCLFIHVRKEISLVHFDMYLSFFHLGSFNRSSNRSCILSFFLFFEFAFKSGDLFLDCFLVSIECFFFGIECFNLIVYCIQFLICCCFFDCLRKFGFSCFHIGKFADKFIKSLLALINLLFQHQCFQCHLISFPTSCEVPLCASRVCAFSCHLDPFHEPTHE